MKEKSGKFRSTIIVDEAVWIELRKIAVEKKMSASKLINSIIADYVNRYKSNKTG